MQSTRRITASSLLFLFSLKQPFSILFLFSLKPPFSFSLLFLSSLKSPILILISLPVSIFSSMASSQTRTLTALIIFQNFLFPVMHRSVHVYRTEEGKEELEEREYLLHEMDNFEENKHAPVITLYKFDVSTQFVGNQNGVWKCMFVYDSNRYPSTGVDASPEWLAIAENPKMELIPTLANDLRAISELALNVKFEESSKRSIAEENEGNDIKSQHLEKKRRVPFLDLNTLSCLDSEDEEHDQSVSG